MKYRLILSCEHAGNSVPAPYQKIFNSREWLLETHRGFDPGAGAIAKHLSAHLKTKLYLHAYTRLLCDVNRTLDQDTIFSVVTSPLPPAVKDNILKKYYHPYRNKLFKAITTATARQQVLHVSIHSFTPVLKGSKRSCDIGLLFKKSDRLGRAKALLIKEKLKKLSPSLKVKLNYPYDAEYGGIMNAINSDLPKARQKKYSGIFIEVNQRLAKKQSVRLARLLSQALTDV